MLIKVTLTADLSMTAIVVPFQRATHALKARDREPGKLLDVVAILRRGTFESVEITVLQRVANDTSLVFGTRCLAYYALDWLRQKSARWSEDQHPGNDDLPTVH